MYAPRTFLLPALWIPGILYEAAVRCRNRLYDVGILRTHGLDAPVISVGNITMGGTGKTPLVIHVADLVARSGATPALLTRGYRRFSRGMKVVAPDAPAAAADVGDEPALIRRRCPSIWLGVHEDRYRAGLEIARRCTNPVFILDDGFQHRRLRRDLDIVVVDSTQRLESNRVAPRGSLREPPESLRRAGMIVVTGAGTPDGNLDRLCRPGTPVLTCVHEIRDVVPLRRWQGRYVPDVQAGHNVSGPVFLVAALGNPARFLADVRQTGLEVRGMRWLRDHSRVTPGVWRECWRRAERAGAGAIVTTEKDAVKVTDAPDIPIYVALQSTRIPDREQFEQAIAGLAGRAR